MMGLLSKMPKPGYNALDKVVASPPNNMFSCVKSICSNTVLPVDNNN